MATEEQATGQRTIDIKQAVETARAYALQLFSDDELRHLRLEEIEYSINDDCWNVTLGWIDPAAGRGLTGPIAVLADPAKQPRVYKVFKVDARSGAVLSMKIREAD